MDKPRNRFDFKNFVKNIFIPECTAYYLYHNGERVGFTDWSGIVKKNKWSTTDEDFHQRCFINLGEFNEKSKKLFDDLEGKKYIPFGLWKFIISLGYRVGPAKRQNCVSLISRPALRLNRKVGYMTFI